MQNTETILHEIPPVWNAESRVLILGTMPSPKSREAGFFYMHPQNRFWRVLPTVFGEQFVYANDGTQKDESANNTPDRNAPDREAAIDERRGFLLRHHIALWDVLSSCEIHGAADSSIKNAVPNDFHELFERSKIHRVFCTGKTAFALWQKHCAAEYEPRYKLTSECLPSTSPANAAWSMEQLTEAYKIISQTASAYSA
ncbi:MAG: uracil-DNA glycosylase family protein [Treponema sp.]|nr:uracil-DNA glycosylase family protein [Treponema sp.]